MGLSIQKFWGATLVIVFFAYGSAAFAAKFSIPPISFEPPDRNTGDCHQLIAYMAGGDDIQPINIHDGQIAGGAVSFEEFPLQWSAIQKSVSGRLYAKLLLHWSEIVASTGLMSRERFFLSVANRPSRIAHDPLEYFAMLPSVREIHKRVIKENGEVDPIGDNQMLETLDVKLNQLRVYLRGEVDFLLFSRSVLERVGAEEPSYTQERSDSAEFVLKRPKKTYLYEVVNVGDQPTAVPSIPINLEQEPLGRAHRPHLLWTLTVNGFPSAGTMQLPPAAAKLILDEVESRLVHHSTP